MPEEISGILAVSSDLGSIRVLACGVRRLAEQVFSGGTPEIVRGTRALPKTRALAISETSSGVCSNIDAVPRRGSEHS
jgi:hypothetical protein